MSPMPADRVERGTAPVTPQSELERILREDSDFIGDHDFVLDRYAYGDALVRLKYRERYLRPGGTVAGPTLFALSDLTMWVLAMSVSAEGKMAVTTDMTMHFMRPGSGADLLGEGKLLRAGRRLIVMEVGIRLDGTDKPMCHATGSYLMPQP